MKVRLDVVDQRSKLKPRRDPYWQRLAGGRSIGFRKMRRGATGTWLGRIRVQERVGTTRTQPDGSKAKYVNPYHTEPLGDFGHLPEGERFDAAKREAEAKFRHFDRGGTFDKATVAEACRQYVEHLRQKNGDDSARDAEGRFHRLVCDDTLGSLDLVKLHARHVADWKTRTLAKGGGRLHYNRNATALRAALNLAKARRLVASGHAWSEELRPLKLGADEGRRKLKIDRDDVGKLIAHASDELKPLLIALALLPLRPGEIAKAKVEAFDARQGILHVHGKTGARDVPLSPEALAHFKTCARDKLPSAWLVGRADGRAWHRDTWRHELKAAAARAGLPAGMCIYQLRHSAITELVLAGVDLFSVAKISGTSVKQIDSTYGHLRTDHARKALSLLALR